MTARFVATYAIIGLCAGIYAALREYQDGALPGHIDSAGAVGMFVACFWPFVAAVMVMGIIAHGLSQLIHSFGRHR